MKKMKLQQKGFTLIEFLIYMGIFSILLLVLTGVFVSMLEIKAESEATSSVTQDGRYIIEKLKYGFARASSVTTPASLGGSGSTLTFVADGITYTYALSSGNLQLTENTGTYTMNSSETTLSSITFQRIGNSGGKDTIKVTFIINSKTARKGGVESRTYTTVIGRR